ncbi:hypothetical protein G9A89_017273 [Geosiphon pyriformis]|nr:hypothetical protein G9A89_017273 [Geosiphon pyriformis]
MPSSFDLFSLIVILICSYVGIYYFRYFTRKNPLPGPLPLPLIGNLHLMKDLAKLGQRLEAEHGDIFEVYVGSERIIWVAREDSIQKILKPSVKTNFFQKASGSFSDGANELGFHTNGIRLNRNVAHWRFNSKALVQSVMSTQFLRELNGTTQQLFVKLSKYWLKCIKDQEKPIDLIEWLARFTAEVTLKRVANHSMALLDGYNARIFPNEIRTHDQILEAETSEELISYFHKLGGSLGFMTVIPSWIRHYVPGMIQQNKKSLSYKQYLDNFLLKLINQRRVQVANMKSNEEIGADLLGLLITTNTTLDENQISHGEDSRLLTDREIQGIMLEAFGAGSDTTAHSICYVTYYLSKNPKCLEKLLAEIKAVVGMDPDSPVPYEKLEKLIYLEAIIQETARLSSVSPVNIKQATNSDEIGGYTWPAGQVFFLNIQGLSYNSSVYANPEKFDPDRWLVKDDDAPGHFKLDRTKSYMFSRGLHMCPGRLMAMTQIKIFVLLLNRKFEIKLADENAILDTEFIVVNRCKELKVFLKPRAFGQVS